MQDNIIIKGAREHNLKNIDLELPRNKLIVFTGISGSGKSTLAFDTIFAEGQRRYLESLSSYARQFLGQMEKPDVDSIENLSPAISIDQKSASHNPRSTVGTITEIYDYLRVLFARIGIPHCPICGKKIEKFSLEQMVDKVLDLPEGESFKILSPIVRGRKGEYHELLNDLFRKGYTKARIDGKEKDLSRKVVLSRYRQHTIEVVIDSSIVKAENLSRITEGIEESLKLSQGLVIILSNGKEQILNQNLLCPEHGVGIAEIEPRIFSFNSPYGACPQCGGLGSEKRIDANLIIADKNLSLSQGSVLPYSYKPNNYYGAILRAVANHFNFSEHTPIKNLPEEYLETILFGTNLPERLRVRYFTHGRANVFWVSFQGIIPLLERRYRQTTSDYVRQEIEHYMSQTPCRKCLGNRLKNESLLVKIKGRNIAEITALSILKAGDFFKNIELSLKETMIAEKIIKEIQARLHFLINVGLDYITLDRPAYTLAGGEAQRIRLASQIGSGLVGVLYILDEPSIGLHSRDNQRLLETLKHLRDLGNTVLVIEHDEETIRQADLVVDIGPGAGRFGGEIVAKGQAEEIMKVERSLTGQYLAGKKQIPIPLKRRKIEPPAGGKFLTIVGASEHNLKNLTVHFPLGVLIGVTGVSGSGKSSLINDCLFRGLARKISGALEKPGKFSKIEGSENLNKVIIIDQSPIGRTPRSNPATYTGVFTFIRELFSKTPPAKARGYMPGRFSFNVSGGRCDNCRGDGFIKIEMHFLPDVFIPCETCGGKRFNQETLAVKFKGKSIADVLEMTVAESCQFFQNIPHIADILKTLEDVGLSYIHLGQAATTLSGGEAQRIKLAAELSRRARGKTLYILDEPTTGLHFEDIKHLLEVLHRLVDQKNTVIVIEHNLEVIKTCDYLIDLGPEGGEAGGQIVAAGTPEEVAQNEKSYTGQFLKKILDKKNI